MHIKKIISILTLSTLLIPSTTTWALPQDKLHERIVQHELMKNKLEEKKLPSYYHDISYIDEFNNVLYVQFFNEMICRHTHAYDKPIKQYIGVKREGYQPVDSSFDLNKTPQYKETAILKPITIENTISGVVKFPSYIDNNGSWYLEVKKSPTSISSEGTNTFAESTINAYMLIQKDASFKMYNLPKGAYTFNLVQGSVEPYGFLVRQQSTPISINIEGDLKKDFDFTKGELIQFPGINTLFNQVDYSDPIHFLKITPHLQIPENEKSNIANKFNKKKDISTIEEILKYMRSEYHDMPKDIKRISGNPLLNNISVASIITRGYAAECQQFATLFEALCRNAGIPTVEVQTINIENAAQVQKGDLSGGLVGHVYTECYIDGKWILVNPTNSEIFLDYDKDDFVIQSLLRGKDKYHYYVFYKGNDISNISTASSKEGLYKIHEAINRIFYMTDVEIGNNIPSYSLYN